MIIDYHRGETMLRHTSSIGVPSLCLILSACVGSEPQAGLDDSGTGSESSTTSDSTDEGTSEETDTTGDAASCPPEGPFGTEVGDTIDDLVFFRQNGDPIALHAACGQPPPALILFGTAAW